MPDTKLHFMQANGALTAVSHCYYEGEEPQKYGVIGQAGCYSLQVPKVVRDVLTTTPQGETPGEVLADAEHHVYDTLKEATDLADEIERLALKAIGEQMTRQGKQNATVRARTADQIVAAIKLIQGGYDGPTNQMKRLYKLAEAYDAAR